MPDQTDTRAVLQARLQSLTQELVRMRAHAGHRHSEDAIQEALTSTVEALAEIDGQPFDRLRGLDTAQGLTPELLEAMRGATTEAEVTRQLESAPEGSVREALLLAADPILVTPEHFTMLGPDRPSRWGFYQPDNSFRLETQHYLDGRLHQVLGDVHHPSLTTALRAINVVAGFSTSGSDHPFSPRVLAFAEGRVAGATPTQQRLAATALIESLWATPQALESIVRLGGREDLTFVQQALSHAQATLPVWRAALESPLFPDLVIELTKIPGACADRVVWERLYAALQEDRFPDENAVARVMKSAPNDRLGSALGLLVRQNPERALNTLGRLTKSRLLSLEPDVLLPLLESSKSHIREAALALTGTIGPAAVRPGRKTRR